MTQVSMTPKTLIFGITETVQRVLSHTVYETGHLECVCQNVQDTLNTIQIPTMKE